MPDDVGSVFFLLKMEIVVPLRWTKNLLNEEGDWKGHNLAKELKKHLDWKTFQKLIMQSNSLQKL